MIILLWLDCNLKEKINLFNFIKNPTNANFPVFLTFPRARMISYIMTFTQTV